jgi:predicted membrane metal-binding protein
MSDGATGARGSERIALNRAYAVISPDQITIKPARMGLVGPAIQSLLTLAALWAMVTYINSLPLWLLMVLLTFVIVSGPIAVLGLVYNILGSAFLMERKKGTCRWQQGFLGLGLGTRELVPFPRIGSIEVTGNFEEELGSGDLQDVVHWQLWLVKDNGRTLPIASISAARPLADIGLERANTLAEALAEMSGSKVVPGAIPEWALLLHEDDDENDPEGDPEGEGDR